MPKERWYGYIKDYDGGTLMECYIHPTINFLNVPEMVRQQRAFVMARLRERSNAHVSHPGLREGEWDFSSDPHSSQRITDALERVSGLREAGWTHEDIARSLQRESQRDQHNLQHELQQVRARRPPRVALVAAP